MRAITAQSRPPAPPRDRGARSRWLSGLTLRCTRCAAPQRWGFSLRCARCGSAVDPCYDLTAVTITDDRDPVARYFDLVPIIQPSSLIPGASTTTPCTRAGELGRQVGLPHLWLKHEFRQPTGSTKDRMAAVVVPVLRELGVREFVASSTGNSSTALARAAALAGGPGGHFFCSAEFAARHGGFDRPGIELHVVQGDFAAAEDQAKAFAADRGLTWEGGFFNWARREGLKLAYLEAFDQLPVTPDVVVQAISSGMGVVGAQKGIEEYLDLGRLDHQPRILMVQQDSCAPMSRGWQQGKRRLGPEDVISNPAGLATAILRGDGAATYPYLYDIAARTGGEILSVSEAELVGARRLLRSLEGLEVCYASATCLAGALRALRAGLVRPAETVLVNLTGSDRA